LGDCVGSAFVFQMTYHDVATASGLVMTAAEHGVGLTDPRGDPQVGPETAGRGVRSFSRTSSFGLFTVKLA
jgi:hypothetical protein